MNYWSISDGLKLTALIAIGLLLFGVYAMNAQPRNRNEIKLWVGQLDGITYEICEFTKDHQTVLSGWVTLPGGTALPMKAPQFDYKDNTLRTSYGEQGWEKKLAIEYLGQKDEELAYAKIQGKPITFKVR